MPLVKCPDCGKEISSRAEACPFCGCPINEETLKETENTYAVNDEPSYIEDFSSKATALAKGALSKVKEVSSYKKVGALEIDEANRRFKIVKTANKDGTATKLLKGTAALYTMGLSIAAEKAIKAATRDWYSFDDVISYRVSMDNKKEYSSSGSRVTLVKGFSTKSHKGSSKTVTQKASIILKMNLMDEPAIEIPIITKPLSGKEFDKANSLLRETTAALDLIIHNR